VTVNTTDITSGPYTGNGVTDTFAYDFRIEEEDQLTVYQTTDAGALTTLTLTTDYTITGVGDDAGGNVVLNSPLDSGYTLYIRSNYSLTQETDFSSQGAFDPEIHETAMDKITFLLQQQDDQLDRAVKFADSYSGGASAELPAPEAGRYVRWNAAGNALEYGSSSSDLSAPGPIGGDTPSTGEFTDLTVDSLTFTDPPNSGFADISGTPEANDFARFTDSNTLEGRSYAEVRADLGLEIGTDVQAYSAVLAATTASFTTADKTKLDYISVTGAINLDNALVSGDIGSSVQGYDADTLKADTADTLTAGYSNTDYDAGTKSSGTYTPDPDDGNQQYCVNGGAFTLAPPSNTCTMTVHITNNGSAGAITTSGFTKVVGDDFTTTDTDEFICYITKTNSRSVLNVVALQ
jgi:hypothetical protein